MLRKMPMLAPELYGNQFSKDSIWRLRFHTMAAAVEDTVEDTVFTQTTWTCAERCRWKSSWIDY